MMTTRSLEKKVGEKLETLSGMIPMDSIDVIEFV